MLDHIVDMLITTTNSFLNYCAKNNRYDKQTVFETKKLKKVERKLSHY